MATGDSAWIAQVMEENTLLHWRNVHLDKRLFELRRKHQAIIERLEKLTESYMPYGEFMSEFKKITDEARGKQDRTAQISTNGETRPVAFVKRNRRVVRRTVTSLTEGEGNLPAAGCYREGFFPSRGEKLCNILQVVYNV